MAKEKNLVYSTDPVTRQKIASQSRQHTHATTTAPADGIVRIHRETKGRGGKGVSVVIGLALGEEALKELAKQLKQHCGTGGTVKEGTIEIQGDQREKIKAYLEKLGYRVKLAGG